MSCYQQIPAFEELVALHNIRCRIKFLISQNATSFGTNFDPCIKTVLTLAILLRRTMPNMCNLCDEFVLGNGPHIACKNILLSICFSLCMLIVWVVMGFSFGCRKWIFGHMDACFWNCWLYRSHIPAYLTYTYTSFYRYISL